MLNRRGFLACSAGAILSANPVLAQTAVPIPVVATFSILGDVVRQIGGDRVKITTLVGANVDAHGFQPSPKDARALKQARLLVVNGLGFDSWADRLVTASGFEGSKLVASRGVRALSVRGSTDPHAWQDVSNVHQYAVNIRDGLSAIDPAGASYFASRTAAYQAQLSRLDGEIKGALAAIPQERRRIVTSHDAFSYFGDAYDVVFLAPQGVSTEAEPSAQDIARLITQVREQKIKAIFIENMANGRVVQQVARETGARVGGVIYSDALGGGTAGTYLGMMRHNIKVLSAALR